MVLGGTDFSLDEHRLIRDHRVRLGRGEHCTAAAPSCARACSVRAAQFALSAQLRMLAEEADVKQRVARRTRNDKASRLLRADSEH